MGKFSASTLSKVLIGLIIIAFAGSVFGAWYLQQNLTSLVEKASSMTVTANNSEDSLDSAKTLQIYLEKHASEVAAAEKIVADASSYKYQNQIVSDLSSFAVASGVSLTGFTFSQTIESVKADATGLKPLATTITLADKTPYAAYRSFIKRIEQNSTKMQITNVSLVPNMNDPNLLSSPSLVVEVYVNNQ